MAYDEGLAERIRETIGQRDFNEKKMFGGLCFMVRGNMLAGVIESDLMVRVGPLQYQECLALPGVREMDFTGRPLTGMAVVDAGAISEDADLAEWIDRCFDFVDSLPEK